MNELLLFALQHYGIKEVLGDKSNPAIMQMFRELGETWVKDDSTAWCSAAMNYFCKRTGYERSGKLNARSWLTVGEEVTEPELGDVVVFWRNDPKGWEGHVGLYISEDNGLIYTLGGNQGNGVFISLYPKNRVLGYRRISKI